MRIGRLSLFALFFLLPRTLDKRLCTCRRSGLDDHIL
jgi:hypothetical protein